MTLLFIYIFMALTISFICSISEAVLLKVTPQFVESLKQANPQTYHMLKYQTTHVNKSLAAILSLNTIANTVGAAGAGGQAVALYGSIALGIVSAIMTVMILVFSEIIPKTVGAIYWRQLAPTVAHILKFLIVAMYPFVELSKWLTHGIRKKSHNKTSFKQDEFIAMAELGVREGFLKSKDSKILSNLFNLRATPIRTIMTPRTVVFSLPESFTVSDFFKENSDVPFSRIPIYKSSADDITGFVLTSDLLKAKIAGKHSQKLSDFKRDIRVVPDSISISRFFEYMLNNGVHLVMVVDEYGSIEGLATMEDVLETLLGLEIVDEVDSNVDMQELARSNWQKRAKKLGVKPNLSEKEPPENKKNKD